MEKSILKLESEIALFTVEMPTDDSTRCNKCSGAHFPNLNYANPQLIGLTIYSLSLPPKKSTYNTFASRVHINWQPRAKVMPAP